MPRHIIEHLIIQIERDIRMSFQAGSAYRSIRDISSHFQVSSQTAHKAVKQLVRAGLLTTEPRKGIVVLGSHPSSAKSVILVSNNPDPRFNAAFLKGAQNVLSKEGVNIQLVLNTTLNTNSLQFGDFLLKLNTHSIITLGFREAALGFYHALQHGINIIADIELDEIPTLPVVQTHNTLHGIEASKIIKSWNRKKILAVTFGSPESTRFVEFKKSFLNQVPKGEVHFVNLSRPESVGLIHRFFLIWSEDSAVFSLDYSANYVISPYFQLHRVSPEKSFLVYDAESDCFQFGKKQVPAVGPSLEMIGQRLAENLLYKLRNGKWPLPLVQKL